MEQEQSKNQIIYVPGGDSFETKDEFYTFLRNKPFDPYEERSQSWREWLQKETESDYEFHYLSMPNRQDADFEAWKIWFEKVLPYLNSERLILIGYSLGGSFYLRYLTENTLPKRIDQLHLVAPAVDNEDIDGSTGNFASDITKIGNLTEQVSKVHVYHSRDDTIVPVSHTERLQRAMPDAQTQIFEGRSHFLQSEFPELLQNIYQIDEHVS